MKQGNIWLRSRPRILSIVANAGWLGIERIVRAATSFMVVVWVARTLGPELFGALNFAQSIVIGLVPLVSMGLNSVLVRDLVQKPEKRDALLASALLIRLGGALLLLVAAQVLCFILTDNDPQIMWLVAILAMGMFAYLADGIDSDYQARMQNKAIVKIKLLGFVVCTVIKILLIYLVANVAWFAIVMSFENLLIAGMMWQAARQTGHGFEWRPSLSVIRTLMLQAAPLFLVALLANLFGRVDQVLLGAIAGFEKLGTYAVAWKVVEALGMFTYFAVTALAPALSILQRESQALFESRYMLATRTLFWLSVCTCGALFLVLPKILPWAFGARYADAVGPMNILLWTLPFMILSHMSFQWVLHMGGMRYIIGQGVFMLCSGLLLCWWLIGYWGPLGAASAILLTHLLTQLCYPTLMPTGRKILRVQMQSVFGWRRG